MGGWVGRRDSVDDDDGDDRVFFLKKQKKVGDHQKRVQTTVKG